jgi:hypothetical protein
MDAFATDMMMVVVMVVPVVQAAPTASDGRSRAGEAAAAMAFRARRSTVRGARHNILYLLSPAQPRRSP